MAKVYAPPTEHAAPRFDPKKTWDENHREEAAYLARLGAALRKQATVKDRLVGREVTWPRADGYARYLVAGVRPLSLVHLPLGDGWRLPAAHERGLTLADVRASLCSPFGEDDDE